MRTRKAQIAMEYLATYGWALFAMFAVVAVLVASGMLGSGRYQSEECTFAPNLPCNNIYFEKDLGDPMAMTAHINITNTQGFPMYIVGCNYTLVGGSGRVSLGLGDPKCDQQFVIRQGESFLYVVDGLKSTTPLRSSELRTIYVTYMFKNCQEATGADTTAMATACLDPAFPEHLTSGKITATVRG